MTHFPRRALLGLLAAGGLAKPFTVRAADYPSRAVRIIVPYAAGGSSDVVARFTAELLRPRMDGQPVVVENRPSANAVIGMQHVASATPDGYTLLLGGASTNAVNPHLYRRKPYDGIADYTALGLVGTGPLVVSVHPGLPIHNLQELIAYAKANPGKLAFGSSVGVTLHLAGELLKTLRCRGNHGQRRRRVTAESVHQRGGMRCPLKRGRPNSAPFIADGRLRPIVVPAPRRAAALPEVLTSAEAGLPAFEVLTWFGLFGPASMPVEIVTTLNRRLNAGLAERATEERLPDSG